MKILIIDDESLARDILKNQLNKFHYQDILMADNGQDALSLLKNELPDVVFLDICMPEMSGIELMERAADFKKQFIFIILSGHNLFEYAQRTMELGAYKYLLKPVEDMKLQEAMEAAEEKLNIIRVNKEKFIELNHSRTRDRNLLKKQYIYEIVSGNGSNSSIYDNALSEQPIEFAKPLFQISCFTIRDNLCDVMDGKNQKIVAENREIAKEDQAMIQFGIENITNEIAKLNGMDAYFFSDNKIYGILMNYDQPHENDKELYEQIFINIKKFVGYFKQSEITFGVGREVLGLQKIQEAYTLAKDTVNKRLILGGGSIYFAALPQVNERKGSDVGPALEESIIKCMYQGDVEQIERYVDDLYAPFINLLLADVKKLNKMHLNLFVILHKELEKKEIDSSEVLDNEFSLYNKIQAFDTIEEMKEFLLGNILLCMKALAKQSGIGNDKIMIRAKEYIGEHIGFNLTLESVAEYMNFSPAYFSKYFKNEEGLNFIDYVNNVRIKEAKKLLNRNIKTADICDKIGFLDVKHFYKIFKRIEGVTPGQYKKGISGEN